MICHTCEHSIVRVFENGEDAWTKTSCELDGCEKLTWITECRRYREVAKIKEVKEIVDLGYGAVPELTMKDREELVGRPLDPRDLLHEEKKKRGNPNWFKRK